MTASHSRLSNNRMNKDNYHPLSYSRCLSDISKLCRGVSWGFQCENEKQMNLIGILTQLWEAFIKCVSLWKKVSSSNENLCLFPPPQPPAKHRTAGNQHWSYSSISSKTVVGLFSGSNPGNELPSLRASSLAHNSPNVSFAIRRIAGNVDTFYIAESK